MTSKLTLISLAERAEAVDAKLKRAIDNAESLTAGGQAIVIAMLVTLNLPLFSEVATALRALAARESGE